MNKTERAKEFQIKFDMLLDDYSDIIYKEFAFPIKDMIKLLVKIIQLEKR